MNKTLFVVFISLIINTSNLKSQNDETPTPDFSGAVSLTGCAGEVVQNDTVRFILKNETDQTIYFSVALEEKIGGVWIEVSDDIFVRKNDKRKARNVRILMPEEQKTIEWDMPDYLTRLPKPHGLCRFRVGTSDSPFDQKKLMYSDEFLIY